MKRKVETTVIIEKGEDGTFSVYTTGIDSVVVGEGSTVNEAKADFHRAIQEVKDLCTEMGKEIPFGIDAEFVYKYDISSLFNLYPFINVSQFAKMLGINPSLMRQYRMGNTPISESKVLKIQTELHRIGKELSSINLI